MRTNRAIQISLALAVAATGVADVASAASRRELQDTRLISRAIHGGLPNGPSSNAVISNDRRYARAIAFESAASDLVRGDTNGVKDVFVIRRANKDPNVGRRWQPGKARRISRPRRGGQANGPSWGAAIGGGFDVRPKCVAFLSAASNLIGRDTNGKVDAFVTKVNGKGLRRVSLPGNRQAKNDTTQVAVSGDCKKIAFVTNGYVYVRSKGRTRKLRYGRDPSFATGRKNHLVFAGPSGVFFSKNARRKGKLIVPGGRNPAYNHIKRQVVTFERYRGGHLQIWTKDLGRSAHVVSKRGRRAGNGDSRNPVIGNSGFYIAFQSEATNLSTDAARRARDYNGKTDTYLYTNVRNLTIAQSVFEKGVTLPGGGHNPSMSFYANYIVFDTPGGLRKADAHQVYMRYLGPV